MTSRKNNLIMRNKTIIEMNSKGCSLDQIAKAVSLSRERTWRIIYENRNQAKKTLIELAKEELYSDFEKVIKQQAAVTRLFNRYCEEEKIEPDDNGMVLIGEDNRIIDESNEKGFKDATIDTKKRKKLTQYLLENLKELIGMHNSVIDQKIKILVASEPEKYTPQEVNAIFLKIGGLFREILPDDKVPQFINVLKTIKENGSIPLLIGGDDDAIEVAKKNVGPRKIKGQQGQKK